MYSTIHWENAVPSISIVAELSGLSQRQNSAISLASSESSHNEPWKGESSERAEKGEQSSGCSLISPFSLVGQRGERARKSERVRPVLEKEEEADQRKESEDQRREEED